MGYIFDELSLKETLVMKTTSLISDYFVYCTKISNNSKFNERVASIAFKYMMLVTKYTETNMIACAIAICVQRSDDSRFCNSHCVSHFAAFFIVFGA